MSSTETATPTDCPNNFYLLLTEHEWKQLELAAQKNGKKNARRLIHAEMHKLAKAMTAINCEARQDRRGNIYEIPQELKPFYKMLACHFGTTVHKIMFRLLIQPHLHATPSADHSQ